jgi:hypothetical protein
VIIDKKEQKELLRLAGSSSLREDMNYLSTHRHNPLVVNGRVSMDRLLDFLTQFNEFINHTPKPLKPIIDRIMRL